MYLFQPMIAAMWQQPQFHLHSTMYLFQHVSPCGWIRWQPSFTFHYVSISTRSPDIMPLIAWEIYIPLCIYFNPIMLTVLSCVHYHLHSTMYLFQHNLILHKIRVIFIYIPLCIYFNSVRTSKTGLVFLIYIPLCIYFNIWKFYEPKLPDVIYIPLCIYFNRNRAELPETVQKIFTFHYVSIST